MAPAAVESSIAVEDAVENRGLCRVFASRTYGVFFRQSVHDNHWEHAQGRFRQQEIPGLCTSPRRAEKQK